MILLERYAYLPAHSEGVLSLGEFECFALERPWLGNLPGRSCIPEGLYRARRGRYNAGGYPCIELVSVPARTQIKLHGANRVDQLQGCIAPGLRWGVQKEQRALLQSRVALEQLMDLLPADAREFEFQVRYRSRYGP